MTEQDCFRYFTTWSLLVSYSIFIWTVLLGAPKWLFLFAACFLTTTSILGTFFLTIPTAQIDADKRNTTIQQILLEDSLIHSGPLIIFLLLFNFLSRRTTNDIPRTLIKGNKPFVFTLQGYHKMIIVAIVIIFGYLGYIEFEKIYFYDYFTLVILCACIFVTSFQVYSSLLPSVDNFQKI